MNVMREIISETEELRRRKAGLVESLKAVFDAIDGVKTLEYTADRPFLQDETGDGDRDLYLTVIGGHMGILEIVSTVEGRSFRRVEDMDGNVQLQLAEVELMEFLKGYLVLISAEIKKYGDATAKVQGMLRQQ